MPPPARHGELSAFQREVLARLFESERDFFLTGGAALVGYYLHHRLTDDLDLFTASEEAFARGPYVLADVAHALGARVEVRQESPSFRRSAVIRADDFVVVDMVLDRVPQLHAQKREIDHVRVDPPDEILANKLTALVGRMEERDLVDVLFLERTGYRVEDALAAALDKDGGCTPATLAWLLSEIRIPDDAALPAGIAPEELRAFIDDLVVRMRRVALPSR
jgi:predicted nucleotidyltransferase component of viral defense system